MARYLDRRWQFLFHRTSRPRCGETTIFNRIGKEHSPLHPRGSSWLNQVDSGSAFIVEEAK